MTMVFCMRCGACLEGAPSYEVQFRDRLGMKWSVHTAMACDVCFERERDQTLRKPRPRAPRKVTVNPMRRDDWDRMREEFEKYGGHNPRFADQYYYRRGRVSLSAPTLHRLLMKMFHHEQRTKKKNDK